MRENDISQVMVVEIKLMKSTKIDLLNLLLLTLGVQTITYLMIPHTITSHPITVTLPNGNSMVPNQKGELPFSLLPPEVTTTNIFSVIKNKAL